VNAAKRAKVSTYSWMVQNPTAGPPVKPAVGVESGQSILPSIVGHINDGSCGARAAVSREDLLSLWKSGSSRNTFSLQ